MSLERTNAVLRRVGRGTMRAYRGIRQILSSHNRHEEGEYGDDRGRSIKGSGERWSSLWSAVWVRRIVGRLEPAI